jgi:hypothetical protein
MRNYIALLLIVSGLAYSCQPAKEPAVPLEMAGLSMTENNDSLSYNIDIQYLAAQGGEEKLRGTINQRIEQAAAENATAFKEFIQDFEPMGLRELEGFAFLRYNNGRLLSLSQRFIWAVPGTSTLIEETVTHNLRIPEGDTLSLDELFAEPAAAKAEVLEKVKGAILKQYGPGLCRELEGVEELEKFCISDKGLIFFLDLYQGNPACRQAEITLPWAGVEGLLSKEMKARRE